MAAFARSFGLPQQTKGPFGSKDRGGRRVARNWVTSVLCPGRISVDAGVCRIVGSDAQMRRRQFVISAEAIDPGRHRFEGDHAAGRD